MDGARPERLTSLVWLVRVVFLALNDEGELPERISHRSWLPGIFGRTELLQSNKQSKLYSDPVGEGCTLKPRMCTNTEITCTH